jgi:hypothetical protein
VDDEAPTTVLHAQREMKKTPQLKDGDQNGPSWWLTTAAAPWQREDGKGRRRRSGARIAGLASSYGDSGHSTTVGGRLQPMGGGDKR